MERKNLSTGTKWEDKVSYSRAVAIGNTIEVAGTVAVDGLEIMHKGDPYMQSIFILSKIEASLKQLGASKKDIVRTRMFVTNIEEWEEVGRAHGEFFEGINPVTTMVEVAKLIHPDYLVEIEASAVLSQA